MTQSRTRIACGAALALLSLTACTRLLPTSGELLEPLASPAASLPQVAPTPATVPTPLPTATPTATSCPTLLGIRLQIFATQPARDRVVLDATPLTEQCAATFPDRLVCPLGQPGTSRRDECEQVRIGVEGPEWSIKPYGGYGIVEALPGTGYLAEVFGRGLVTACSRVQPDVCTFIEIN